METLPISKEDGMILLRMIQIRALCSDLHSNAFTLRRLLQLSIKLGLTDSKVVRLNKEEAEIAIETHVDLCAANIDTGSESSMEKELDVIKKLFKLTGDTLNSSLQKTEKKKRKLAKRGKK
jgi:hypothetical protein